MLEAFRKLHQFHTAFDEAQRRLEETIGKPTCMSGCGLCCETNTPSCMIIESIDAVSILTGSGKLGKVLSITEGWLLERHNEAPSYDGMLVGCFVPPKIRDEFAALNRLRCPFLLDTKECLIHDARPMVCRAYGVTRSSMGGCPRAPGKGETLTQFMYMQVPGLMADIHGFKEHYRGSHREWVTFGFLPTLIYRAAREKQFRDMVRDNRIATAKIIGTELDQTLMWQPQIEAIQKGMGPDLVANMA